jgi:hypothetical protein
MAENTSKNRKSESQEIFEQADNAGRFAGDDINSKAARQQAEDNIRHDSQLPKEEQNKDGDTDKEARRDPAQSHDYKGESQNVNDDSGRTLNREETQKAKNKANEGLRQGRNNN